MVEEAFGISARGSPILLHSVAPRAASLASAANRSMPLSLSKPHAVPVLLHVTDWVSARRASNAAHGVSASTPTPYGSLTILTAPAITLALASSILSGTEPSTGARSTAP